MDKKILVDFREVYGKKAIYVISPHAQPITRLTGKKTIDQHDIAALKALGFTVAVPSQAGRIL